MGMWVSTSPTAATVMLMVGVVVVVVVVGAGSGASVVVVVSEGDTVVLTTTVGGTVAVTAESCSPVGCTSSTGHKISGAHKAITARAAPTALSAFRTGNTSREQWLVRRAVTGGHCSLDRWFRPRAHPGSLLYRCPMVSSVVECEPGHGRLEPCTAGKEPP